jgi:hypothetical protein
MKLGGLLLILFTFQTLLANDPVVSEPTNPTPPTLSSSSDSPKKEKKGKKQLDVFIKLCDGREVKGRMDYQKEELFFQHEKEGIKYTKKVQMQTIRQIYFLNYTSKQIKKAKDGTAFQFDPGEIEISLKDNEIFKISNLSTNDFQKIEIQNSNGTTILYTYWIDLLYDSGKWYSKLPSIKGNLREDCHPDVIKMIRIESNSQFSNE